MVYVIPLQILSLHFQFKKFLVKYKLLLLSAIDWLIDWLRGGGKMREKSLTSYAKDSDYSLYQQCSKVFLTTYGSHVLFKCVIATTIHSPYYGL